MDSQDELKATQPIDETLAKSIGLQGIDLVLDHTQEVYYSGQRLSGEVRLDLEESVSAVGIRLKCKGEAQVYFTDRSAGIRRKFSSEENYLHSETYLIGGEADGDAKTTITSGVYPFDLALPENLPCSFEGRYGRVRYSIRALLDITSDYRFSTNIIPFTVAPTLDLNRDSLAPLPISEKQSKIYMGQSEPLAMSIMLPVRGYVPGQAIPIRVELKNSSNVVVKKLRIVLKKVVLYHATEKLRKHKEIIVEIEQPIVKNHDSYDVVFDVPAVPPTGMIHCKLIDVVYTLKVEACVDVSEWYYRMFQKNLKLRSNVMIGTVPLKNYEDPEKMKETNAMAYLSKENKYVEDALLPVKMLESEDRSNLSLPLYEKSRIYRSSKPDRDDPTGDDGDSDGEVKPYSPMYRVYKFESSARKTGS